MSNLKSAYSDVIPVKLTLKGATKRKTKRKISEVASTDASPTNHGDESKSTQSIELSGEPPQTRMKTKAELEFERIQDKKMSDQAAKKTKKTHRETINEFNAKLSKMTDINDIPRVGPG